MNKYVYVISVSIIFFISMILSNSASSANESDNEPSEINADAIEYDMNTGVVAAAGNVLLKHGSTRATGLQAIYNVKTREAHLMGEVIVIKDDIRITCDVLASNGQGYMAADGNVIVMQTISQDEKYPNGDTRTFKSDHVDYYPNDKKHFVIPNGGIAESVVEGIFTATQIEGWLEEEHYIGKGSIHFVNMTRDIEAGGDQIDYFGQESGKAVLTGNAWICQNNNTIRGNRLTIYLSDNEKTQDVNSLRKDL